MSGILDRKSRIIDYNLTENGRSQIQDGDIRFVYATASDRSILYEKDFEKSLLNSEDIAYTKNYLPFEVDTKTFGNLNSEFDLSKTFTINFGNILEKVRNQNEEYSNVTFDNAIDIFLNSNSLGTSLNNLKLISQKTLLNSDGLKFVNKSTLTNDFDFKNSSFILRYPTVKSKIGKTSDLTTIALDKRFSHKKSFLKLIPEDMNGNKLYDEDSFLRDIPEYNDLCVDIMYKSLNINIDYEKINNRQELILEIVKKIKSNQEILKKEYQLMKTTERDSFVFNMYEVISGENSLEKLSILKVGNIIDKEDGKVKKVYLAGKVLNTKENSEDLEEIYTFNQGRILKNTKNTNFAISAYYSFVCLFTIILE